MTALLAAGEVPGSGVSVTARVDELLGEPELTFARALARYIADDPKCPAFLNALAANHAGHVGGVVQAVIDDPRCLELAGRLGDTSGGRDVGRLAAETTLPIGTVDFLATDRRRLDVVRLFARTDLGKKLVNFLIYANDGQEQFRELLESPELDIAIRALSASGRGRDLAKSLTASASGSRLVARAAETWTPRLGLPEADASTGAAAVRASALVGCHLAAAAAVLVVASKVPYASTPNGNQNETDPQPTALVEVELAPALTEASAAGFARAVEPFMQVVENLLQDGLLPDEIGDQVHYIKVSIDREYRENPVGPEPIVLAHWESRLIELVLPFYPRPDGGDARALGSVLAAATAIGSMASSESQLEMSAAAVSAAKELSDLESEPTGSQRWQTTLTRLGWVMFDPIQGSAALAGLAGAFHLPVAWSALLGAILGVLNHLFVRRKSGSTP